ncbi:YiiX/YebB-like N1pC/P60 family cysteine hydrolase [Marinifilum sp. RC60d5]|uniref:YiiX/YebB-like N1pC/P60 family cysteine hydrolase n=1 Tax=Marinifilum sp. RC60d5 TaxID=3458414 RepID=UPI0040363734
MHFVLQKGDLIFQDLDSDSISNAIESVTGGKEQLNFSHVGIVEIDKTGKIFVLEAISKGVSLTPVDIFLERNTNINGKPKVAVARLKSEYNGRIKEAIEYGKSLLGSPYDDVYLIGDSNYYCSELIYEMFANTGDSSELFVLNPMTFKNPDTNEFLPFWIDYYKKKQVEIPEGKLGLNPNGMYKSQNIDIIYPYSEE